MTHGTSTYKTHKATAEGRALTLERRAARADKYSSRFDAGRVY